MAPTPSWSSVFLPLCRGGNYSVYEGHFKGPIFPFPFLFLWVPQLRPEPYILFKIPKMATRSNISRRYVTDFEIFAKKVLTDKWQFLDLCGPHLHNPNRSSSSKGKKRLGGEFQQLDSLWIMRKLRETLDRWSVIMQRKGFQGSQQLCFFFLSFFLLLFFLCARVRYKHDLNR